MPRLKLTKTIVDAAQPMKDPYELRDAAIPGFLLKVTPTGRKVFMVAYVANNGQRRKPAIGRFGEITVEQARTIAQDWLADVRKGKDPSAEKSAARRAPTVEELFERFIADYSEPRNKPSTVEANRSNGKLYIIPHLGQLKASDVSRADISNLRPRRPPIGCCRRCVRCSTWQRSGACALTGRIHAAMFRNFQNEEGPGSSATSS